VVVRVPSRTTLIGIGQDAGLTGGMLLLEGVDNIIVRHLHLSDAYDHFPAWDPKDNGHGEWNSEYDNLSLRNARHVWVDHCTLRRRRRAPIERAAFAGAPRAEARRPAGHHAAVRPGHRVVEPLPRATTRPAWWAAATAAPPTKAACASASTTTTGKA
jgi:hypothetical protein